MPFSQPCVCGDPLCWRCFPQAPHDEEETPMDQDYDPCEHGLGGECFECDIAHLERQAEADDQEIVLLQQLLRGVMRGDGRMVRDAQAYLQARELL